MAISQAVCNVFKQELLKGNHDFDGGATYYIALYTSSATLGATTTAYATANEVTNSSGTAYTAGGKALTSPTVTGGSGTATAFVDFADVSWTSASFTAISHIFPVFFPFFAPIKRFSTNRTSF